MSRKPTVVGQILSLSPSRAAGPLRRKSTTHSFAAADTQKSDKGGKIISTSSSSTVQDGGQAQKLFRSTVAAVELVDSV